MNEGMSLADRTQELASRIRRIRREIHELANKVVSELPDASEKELEEIMELYDNAFNDLFGVEDNLNDAADLMGE